MKKTILAITAFCLACAPTYAVAKKKKSEKKTVTELTAPKSITEPTVQTLALTNPSKQLTGEWIIKTVRNKTIHTSERPHLVFDTRNNQLFGNNGCNVVNGNFRLSGNNIAFDKITTTNLACSSNSAGKNILKALSEANNLTIETEKGIEYMVIRNKANHDLMRLKRINFDFANGAWSVTQIDGESVDINEIRLIIDTDQLKIHGNTGCNIINGTITIDSDKDHAIQFEDITSTKHACPGISTETALLIALEETVSIRQEVNSDLLLIDNKGNTVAVLTPIEIKR